MKRLVYSNEDAIFGMSNVVGRFVKVEENGLPFSFYYSPCNSSHGPRVKPVLSPNRMWLDKAGTLKLCDDWEFVPGATDKHVSASLIRTMKDFFRKYLVLFLLVWDKQVADSDLGNYLEGKIDFSEFVEGLVFYNEYKDELDNIDSAPALEDFCRANNLVNFYGN